MKTYTYIFADGTTQEAEVSDELYKELTLLDRAEKSNNRKETRRHVSMDRLADKGVSFRDYTQDLDFVLAWQEFEREETELENLQKRVFVKFLTDKQAEVFYRYKILKYGKTKIAKNLGITEGAVRKLLFKADEKMNGQIIKMDIFDTTVDSDSDEVYESPELLQLLIENF